METRRALRQCIQQLVGARDAGAFDAVAAKERARWEARCARNTKEGYLAAVRELQASDEAAVTSEEAQQHLFAVHATQLARITSAVTDASAEVERRRRAGASSGTGGHGSGAEGAAKKDRKCVQCEKALSGRYHAIATLCVKCGGELVGWVGWARGGLRVCVPQCSLCSCHRRLNPRQLSVVCFAGQGQLIPSSSTHRTYQGCGQ